MGISPDEWPSFIRKAEDLGVKIIPLTQGRQFDYSGVRFEVLAPAADYVPASAPRNNDSLVLRLTYGQRSAILSGDAERQVESELVSENLVRHTDILKVAHHGSKTSTTEPFLEAVHPAFAVISAGFENLYGHPNADVLDRLQAAKIEVFRTDQSGAITIRTDGRRIEIQTQ